MAQRGDVLRASRRLGFAADRELEALVVVQADPLNSVLSTVLVVPLDSRLALHAGDPSAVPVPGGEVGSAVDHVAVTAQLQPIRLDHVAPGVVGKLSRRTLKLLDRTLKLVLDL